MNASELVPDQINNPNFPPEPQGQVADVFTRVLTVAAASLENTPNGIPDEIYLAPFKPPDDCCNFIAGYPDRHHQYRNTRDSGFPVENEAVSANELYKQGMKLGWAVDMILHVRRPCVPTLQDSIAKPFPSGDETHEWMTRLLIDQNTMLCAIANGIKEGWLLDDIFGGYFQIVIGPTFNEWNADCAGFWTRLTIDLQCHCDAELGV